MPETLYVHPICIALRIIFARPAQTRALTRSVGPQRGLTQLAVNSAANKLLHGKTYSMALFVIHFDTAVDILRKPHTMCLSISQQRTNVGSIAVGRQFNRRKHGKKQGFDSFSV